MPLPKERPPEGLSETPFGLRYYIHEMRTTFEAIDLRRKGGELWGELTVRCGVEGVRTQLDGDRIRQGNFNFSSISTRNSWAKACWAVADVIKEAVWANLFERMCQEILDHEREGSIHGHEITGQRMGSGGRPWAAWPLLPHGENATLFARGGAGKTGLTAELAFGCALGRSLIPGIRVDRPYRVLILDWETNAETAEDLWGLIAETHKVRVPPGIWYEPMEAPLERNMPKVANIIEQQRADFVILDSVAMAQLSSSEYSDGADNITRIYQAMRKLRTWGLLIDHVTGQDMRSRRVAMKAYGSVYKMYLARHAVALHIGNRAGDTSQAYLVCPKSNVGRDRWAMQGVVIRNDEELRWSFGEPDFDLFDRLTAEQDEEEVPPEENATPKSADMFLNCLYSAHPNGLTVYDIRTATDASSAEFVRKTINALARDGLVAGRQLPGSREKAWSLTQQGIDFYLSEQRAR